MIRRSGDADRGDRVCVVTTVKDTPANLDRFVASNLAAGADHVFMFIDDADPDIHAHFAGHPHVSAVRTGARYWQGRRPPGINARQVVNANLANTLLSAFPEVGWLFHIDGDECLHLDRARLLALPEEHTAVRLRTLEAVAYTDDEPPEPLYKRRLDDSELALLHLLGRIERPTMASYFRGHVAGKSGTRPSLTHRLRVHPVERLDRTKVERFEADFLNVLHRESPSVQEFVRKWTAHLDAERTAHYRGPREKLRAAISVINSSPALSAVRRQELFTELHRRHVQDDWALLDELGYLVRPQADWHAHQPIAIQGTMRRDLDELLDLLRLSDKRHFQIIDSLPPATLVTRLHAEASNRSLRHRLERALDKADAEATPQEAAAPESQNDAE